jgi:predicted dehydrogenase
MIDKILIVGLGSIGKRHLRLVRECMPNADIRVLRRRIHLEKINFADGCFDSLQDACDFQPVVSFIANPAPFHVDTSVALLSSGSHLIIEKPLSLSVSSSLDVLGAMQKYSRFVHVGYNLRFSDSLNYFSEVIHSNVLGKPLSVRCEVGQYLPTWRPGTDYRAGVSARHELGGGVLFEFSHEIDYLRWIFGDFQWVSACISRQSSLDIDVEDSSSLMFGFVPDHNGNSLVASLNMDFIRHDKTRVCTVICEKGSLRWNGIDGLVEIYHEDAGCWDLIFQSTQSRDDSYRLQFSYFTKCINTSAPSSSSLEDGIAVLRVIEAARSSALKSGVKINLI